MSKDKIDYRVFNLIDAEFYRYIVLKDLEALTYVAILAS